MRKIFEKAFTIGFVTSLAKPHRAKQNVTRINGTKYFFIIILKFLIIN